MHPAVSKPLMRADGCGSDFAADLRGCALISKRQKELELRARGLADLNYTGLPGFSVPGLLFLSYLRLSLLCTWFTVSF